LINKINYDTVCLIGRGKNFYFRKIKMPTKYCDRLNMPATGMSDIVFFTKNGLKIANGYKQVILNGKPLIEFLDVTIENIHIPLNQQWKLKNANISHVEYRSRDYCKVKILQNKRNRRYYISPFDLVSDKIPVLISPLFRRKTILATV